MTKIPEGVQTDFNRDTLARDFMRDLYDYWCEARGGASIPPVSAIDPMRLPRSCLPHLSVLEVEPSPFRLRPRLMGTALVVQLGTDLTGRYLDEIPGMAKQLVRMEWCARAQQPYVTETGITFAPNDYKRYQVLILPFGDAEHGVQRIVGAFCFPDAPKQSPFRL
jgi:hypothetical protein